MEIDCVTGPFPATLMIQRYWFTTCIIGNRLINLYTIPGIVYIESRLPMHSQCCQEPEQENEGNGKEIISIDAAQIGYLYYVI